LSNLAKISRVAENQIITQLLMKSAGSLPH